MKQIIPIELETQDEILCEEISKLLYHLDTFIQDETIQELMRNHKETWSAINFVQRNIQHMVDDISN